MNGPLKLQVIEAVDLRPTAFQGRLVNIGMTTQLTIVFNFAK